MKRLKPLISVLANCIIAALILEGFFVLVYYVKAGRYVPAQDIIESMTPDESRRLTGVECEVSVSETSHPYLAFSRLAQPGCPHYDRDSGHTGQVFPRKRNPEKFVVLFTGASVPAQLLADAKPTFGQMLSQQYQYQGREIEVLHGAVVRWKQPQQFILLMLNAHLIDAVVSMEGFNELVSGFGNEYRYDFSTPVTTGLRRSNVNFFSNELLLMSWAYENAFYFVQSGHILKHLKTTVFAFRLYRHWLHSYSDADQERVRAYRQQINPFTLPKSWSYEEKQQHYLNSYIRYIGNMSALAQANDIKFSLFIQPVPLVGKTLTTGEMEALKKYRDYGDNYTVMQRSLMRLTEEGINIHSLADVFVDYPETVYKDGIHLNLDNRGPEILSQAIIDVLAIQWGLEKIPETH